MVLGSLGTSLSTLLSSLVSSRAPIDDTTVDAVLKDICKALLEADVNVKLVQQLRNGIKASLNLEQQPAGINKRRLVHKVSLHSSHLLFRL
jgi:signal recognition particle subunit SRP54